jgi:hypothetical protein
MAGRQALDSACVAIGTTDPPDALPAVPREPYHSAGSERLSMRYVPLVVARGQLLAQVMRDAAGDPRRHSLCTCCGARMPIEPERLEQTARCPACARWQRVVVRDEVPWRLTAAAAEALRRTRSWVRRL